MTNIGVVYFSGTGTTAAVAKAVMAGVASTGATVIEVEVVGGDIVNGRWRNDQLAEQLDTCTGILFGTPTYMGSISAQLKSFLDAMAPRWYSQTWKDKFASGFTASALTSGDKLSTFQALTVFAMQMGMIWVGTGGNFTHGENPHGFYFGTGAVASKVDELSGADLDGAHKQGARMGNLALKLGDVNELP